MSGSLVMTMEGDAAFAETVKSGSRILSMPASSMAARATCRFLTAVAPIRSIRSFMSSRRLQTVDQCFVIECRSDNAADGLFEVGCTFEGVEKRPIIDIRIGLNETATKLGKPCKFVIEGKDVRHRLF